MQPEFQSQYFPLFPFVSWLYHGSARRMARGLSSTARIACIVDTQRLENRDETSTQDLKFLRNIWLDVYTNTTFFMLTDITYSTEILLES